LRAPKADVLDARRGAPTARRRRSRQAKETGLKVNQIFAYFKPEGAAEADDITPADFEQAMVPAGVSRTHPGHVCA